MLVTLAGLAICVGGCIFDEITVMSSIPECVHKSLPISAHALRSAISERGKGQSRPNGLADQHGAADSRTRIN